MEHFPRSKQRPLIIAGDSSGGNLAVVVSRLVTPQPKYLVLLYPALTDADNRAMYKSAQVYDKHNGYFVDQEIAFMIQELYIGKSVDKTDWKIFPLASNCFDNLPPTLIITAEYDALRDEGQEFFKKLEQGGVKATYELIPRATHGFIQVGPKEARNSAIKAITHFLQQS